MAHTAVRHSSGHQTLSHLWPSDDTDHGCHKDDIHHLGLAPGRPLFQPTDYLRDSVSTLTRPLSPAFQDQNKPKHEPPSFAANTTSQSIVNRCRKDSTLSTTSSSHSYSSIKRKPLPNAASAHSRAASRTSSIPDVPGIPPFRRSLTADSPTLYDNPLNVQSGAPFARVSPPLPDDFRERQREFSARQPSAATTSDQSPKTITASRRSEVTTSLTLVIPAQRPEQASNPSAQHQQDALVSNSSLSVLSHAQTPGIAQSRPPSLAMPIFSTKAAPQPRITVPASGAQLDETVSIKSGNSKALPRSPESRSPGTSKLGSFFGWGGNGSPASSRTSFSEDKAYSPIPSPESIHNSLPKSSTSSSTRTLPASIDTTKANAADLSYAGDAYSQLPPATPGSTTQIDEMEDELRAISSELATSIRREMELEDLVERMQSEATSGSGGRRTSDYFSDSGISSVRSGSEHEAKVEELDKLQRQTEREKALIRLELTDKVQEERSRRKTLESKIRILEEKASMAFLQSANNHDADSRVRELEAACEDLRRRLGEERQVKENFEDLLSALKIDLQKSHNERDNLRDEVVPQLRARVEGLEAQSALHEQSAYESTKIQQEVQQLRAENTRMINDKQMQGNLLDNMQKFNSTSEESRHKAPASGLARSNTVTANSRMPKAPRPMSLAQSGSRPPSVMLQSSSSIKGIESRDALVEKVKDVEAQRDALHRALKSLLDRQEHQNRQHESRIKQLEQERDKAMTSQSQRRSYDQEVTSLREEINQLRRRADDAMEQKEQCEKGLGGLRMDLERAEQEIGSLRTMLVESGIAVPAAIRHLRSNSITSNSLEQAYRELQMKYTASLARVKELEMTTDADASAALQRLQTALEQAISERDFLASEEERLRAANASLQGDEKAHIESEQVLADELRTSAKRIEELATQVRQQLASNAALRQRLAETIDRGEREQKSNAARIVHMQGKLRLAEDLVLDAQLVSEDRISRHEEEIRAMKDAHNIQLLRVKDGLRSPRSFAPQSPLSPLFAKARASRGKLSPLLSRTSSGPGISVSEESKMSFLKHRVEDLERALTEADVEMQEVVGRMNTAQIEVMELWNEREEAVRITRRLEREVEDERKKNFESQFRLLQS